MEGDHSKRRVTYNTFTKWKRDLDKDCQTVTWLDCEMITVNGKKTVTKLKCKLCIRCVVKLRGCKYFSSKWINSAQSIRTSNVRDHAHSEQHLKATNLEQATTCGQGPSSYSAIARSLNRIENEDSERLRKKFDISYFVATEKLPFVKYPSICELEQRHGVDIGTTYENWKAGASFIHYIAEARWLDLVHTVGQAKFFSLLLDGSTDVGNIDNEVILIAWCDLRCEDEKIHSRISYFKVIRPRSVFSEGLFQVVEEELQSLGISSVDERACAKLVGIGTDGASSNTANAGLKGILGSKVSWLFWIWCLAHRLELAIKNALVGTSFNLIDELLLKLYYIYENSPKKCHELADIAEDLKQFFEFDDAGHKACESKWV